MLQTSCCFQKLILQTGGTEVQPIWDLYTITILFSLAIRQMGRPRIFIVLDDCG